MVIVALAVAVTLLLVERSPLVAISTVEVSGATVVTPDEVRTASGISPGMSLLRVDLDEAAARVEGMPRIERAEVVRIDPLTIEIRVIERQPVYLARAGDTAVSIDDDGIVLAEGDVSGLVTVDLPSGALPQPGASVDEVPALANAVAVAEGMPGTLRTRIAGYRAEEADRALAVLDDGTLVELGRAEDLDAKARALSVVLEDLAGRTISIIDVRSPSAPVVTP